MAQPKYPRAPFSLVNKFIKWKDFELVPKGQCLLIIPFWFLSKCGEYLLMSLLVGALSLTSASLQEWSSVYMLNVVQLKEERASRPD